MKLSQPAASPVLSVVVPVLDEEEVIDEFIVRLESALRQTGESFEVILVDDGSRDGTWSRIEAAHRRDSAIKGISLLRNFGHQKALLAGLSSASGQAIVTMDGDGQHPPELISRLVEAWRGGCKIVSTSRIDSEDTSRPKSWSSRWFYRLFSTLSGLQLAAGSSDYRLLDRQVVRALLEMRDAEPFLRGAVQWLGGPTSTISFQASPRLAGRSKYGLTRMIRLSAAALVSFSSTPLKLGVWLGIVTSTLAGIQIVYIFVRYFQGATVPGWASLLTFVSFMFGVLFILLGVIGIYLASIHESLKNRPRFLVANVVGLRETESPAEAGEDVLKAL